MSRARERTLATLGSLCMALVTLGPVRAAHDEVQVHAFVNDSCIIADEPFYVPSAPAQGAGEPTNPKFLPLLGAVIGQIASLFLNHEAQLAASHLKARAARKDTRYAMTKQMNLYRAELSPAPTLHINARLGCMTIVAASLEPEGSDCTTRYVPKTLAPETMRLAQSEWKTTRSDDSLENQLRRANVCVQGKARAVYEARFEFSEDGTAYRLKDAGYRIDSLLTTTDKGATRSALYTLKIFNPGASDEQEVLSAAWVNLGTVSAGARSSGSTGGGPFLRVPQLTTEARRAYEQKTLVHQQVMGEIQALKRAMTRNQRMLSGFDARIAAASPDIAEGLRQERTRVAVQYQTQAVELDARNAEYQDLPHAPLEFMPVTIEVAVTETESEKKSQLALADLIGSHSDIVTSPVASAATGLISRQVDAKDVITEPEHNVESDELERARARYFDALTEARTAPGGASTDQQRRLAAARDEYNTARRALGLEQIQ